MVYYICVYINSEFSVGSNCRPLSFPPPPVFPAFMSFLPSLPPFWSPGVSADTISSLLTFLRLFLSELSMFRVRDFPFGNGCFSGFQENAFKSGLKQPVCCAPEVPGVFALQPEAPHPLRWQRQEQQQERQWVPVGVVFSVKVSLCVGGVCSSWMSSA